MIKSRISVCLLATAVIGSFAVLPAAEAKGDVADVVFQQLSGQLMQTVTDCKSDMMDRANDCVAQMSDLISQGNPLAAIPVALLFGGLSIGGRFVQGQLGMNFGVDYALLGVLMITLVSFQFFYRYKIVWVQTAE